MTESKQLDMFRGSVDSSPVSSVEPSNSFLDHTLEYRLGYFKTLRKYDKGVRGTSFGYGLLFWWDNHEAFILDYLQTLQEAIESKCTKN